MSNKNQKLKISSEPQGSEVYFEDDKIGITPGFFEVPRRSNAVLQLNNGLETKTFNLRSSYRWGDSFFANFVWFFWFAPVGWIVDLATGAAWDYTPIPPVSFKGQPFKNSYPEGKRLFSVAPPTSNYNLLSEEIGDSVEAELRKRYSNDKILKYNDTSNIFNNYSYNYGNRIPEFARDDLYSELGSNQIAESEIVRKDEQVEVKTTLTDVFTGKKWEEFSFSVPNSNLKTFKRSGVTEFFSKVLDVIPNTFSYGFKTPTVTVEQPIDFQPQYGPSVDSGHSILSYLSSLGFKNARNPRLVPELHFYFRFVPSVVLDYTRVKFDRVANNDLSGLGFDWYLLLAGIGPEIGLESKFGYLYLQVIPNFGGSYIHSEGRNKYYDSWNASFAAEVEIGYVMFISDRINLRFYANGTSGFNRAWSDTMSFMAGQNIPVTKASEGIGGLAIGYYFPESSSKVRSWLF